MKRIIITSLCALACFASAIAQIGYRQDDITYSLNTDESGKNYAIVVFNTLTTRCDVTIPETITYEGTDYVVTEIGNDAFRENDLDYHLQSISLPNTIQRIGDNAFQNCKKLGLNGTVILPSGLTHIGKAAFRLTGITAIKIPGTVREISEEAFKECYELKSLEIGYGTTTIGANAFNFCLHLSSAIIPSTVETIGNFAFLNCQALKSLNLENVTHIGVQSLKLTALSKVTFSDKLVFIGDQALYGCKFETISLPNSLTTICDRALANNELLTEIYIPENVTIMGKEVFSGCSKLTRVAAPVRFKPNYSQWFASEFNGMCWYDDDASISEDGIIYSGDYSRLIFVPSAYAGNLDIPTSTTSIGAYAAYQCKGISQINLPTSLTEIEPYAFYYAKGIHTADLPNIKHIGQYAFYRSSLQYLNMNENIDSIGSHAFYGLRDFIFPLGVSADIMESAFCQPYKFACSNTFDYKKAIEDTDSWGDTTPYLPIFYSETDIVENGMIFNSSKSVIKYASYATVPTEYSIPASVTEIGDNAFYYCSKLSTLTISEGVKSIGNKAFNSCMIKTLHIPASITSIGSDAFDLYASYPNSPSIYYNSTVPMSGDKNIFKASDYNEAILYIPKGTSGKFLITSPWMYFRNIQEIDFAGIDGVESDECGDAPVEYYNLQGIRVENPESGLYIRRQGNKSTKVYIKK